MILTVIEQHIGKPCPTRHTIVQWTGLPRRLVWQYLEGMSARGKCSVSTMRINDGERQTLRKIMLPDGRSTEWTDRPEGMRRRKDQNRADAAPARTLQQ